MPPIEARPEGRPVAVLFDVGNVIVRWDPRTLYSKIFPDPAECDWFLAEVATIAWHAETDRGLSFAENIALLSARHPKHATHISAWWDRWDEMFSGVISETEAAMHALAARGVPMHGLTNMSVEAWPGVRAMSTVFTHLQTVVVSGAEGLIKPDPAIYALTCERTGLAPHQILFIDDSAANIDAAAAMGFHVHHFTNPAALRPVLEAHGLL